ncbi:hypothetical protein EDB85DRAFT_2149566 [Lactarius pseudohatsudake]|nr:hypothetical protein EDB85DRAFT_2149566 [Lactarius pseudohatsudake]
MNPFRPSPKCHTRTAARRLFSVRGIITKVNGIIRRLFSKAKQEPPAEDIFEGREKELENSSSIMCEEPNIQRDQRERGLTIEALPNEVLLEVFDCHRLLTLDSASSGLWEWHRLAHVCQKWRAIVFASPHRLDLRLVYTYAKPVRESVDCWPALPIVIWYPTERLVPEDEGNVVAALRYPDRICEINLTVTRSLLAKSFVLLRAPFPALERLRLRSQDTMRSLILPTAFLGGAAPRLRDIHLDSTAFPMLPQVLLSAHDLVSLRLDDIPNSGYISPEFFAAGLSVTTRLEYLKISFLSPILQRNTASSTRTHAVLPALTDFQFRGDVDYLENLVTKIDAPALEQFTVTLFEQSTFNIPQLSKFIGRTRTLRSPHQTSIELSEAEFAVTHDFRLSSPSPSSGNFKLQVLYEEEDLQMATLVHISRQLSASLASPERLDVVASSDLFAWRDPGEADAVQWLEFLRLFPGVKRLEVSSTLASIVASAFEQVTRTSDILPSLSELHMGGSQASTSSSIEGFAAVRERSGHPVSVHYQSASTTKLTDELPQMTDSVIAPTFQLAIVQYPLHVLPNQFCQSVIQGVSGPPSLPNDSSAGTTSHDPHNGLKVENITRILCEKLEEAQAQGESDRHVVTINSLPDDVLLEIFDSCRKGHDPDPGWSTFTVAWGWHRLVRVCQRWRQLVFGSPRRLDVQLPCTHGIIVRTNLDFWPPLPIAIHYQYNRLSVDDQDSLLAALEHPDRVSQVDLCLTGTLLEEVATEMEVPFPALRRLTLKWEEVEWEDEDEAPPAFPNGFLGGSAPCLQYLHLECILFPALPTLLFTTTDLVNLSLHDISPDGYISPQAMVACLAALSRLESLLIKFQSEMSRPDQIHPPPATRTVVPSLLSFEFEGCGEYLEDLVARIDSPQLHHIKISYFDQLPEVHVAQLFKFLDRSEDSYLTLIRHADVTFLHEWISFKMHPFPESHPDRNGVNALIYRQGIERQVSQMIQVFSQRSTMLSRVVHFKLSRYRTGAMRHQWLHLLRLFSAARTLHVVQEFARRFARVLESITGDSEMVAEVLPVLDLIYLEGQPVSALEGFLAARQLSGHPITIVDTEAKFHERVKSYVTK